MSWLSVVSVPVFSWAEHRSRSRSLLTKQQTVPKTISTVTFGLLLKMLPCCYHSLGCWSHLVDDSVICNVGVFKSTEGIAPIRSVKQKPTDQKLKCCFKNVMENSQLFPSVCIFFFFYLSLFIQAFCLMLFWGVHFIFWLTCFYIVGAKIWTTVDWIFLINKTKIQASCQFFVGDFPGSFLGEDDTPSCVFTNAGRVIDSWCKVCAFILKKLNKLYRKSFSLVAE